MNFPTDSKHSSENHKTLFILKNILFMKHPYFLHTFIFEKLPTYANMNYYHISKCIISDSLLSLYINIDIVVIRYNKLRIYMKLTYSE